MISFLGQTHKTRLLVVNAHTKPIYVLPKPAGALHIIVLLLHDLLIIDICVENLSILNVLGHTYDSNNFFSYVLA